MWAGDECICDRLARVDTFITWQDRVNVDEIEAFLEVDVDACRCGSFAQLACCGVAYISGPREQHDGWETGEVSVDRADPGVLAYQISSVQVARHA
nr:hypothetical protein [Mycobacterium avium]